MEESSQGRGGIVSDAERRGRWANDEREVKVGSNIKTI